MAQDESVSERQWTCEACGRPVKAGRRFCSMGRPPSPGCADEAMVKRSEGFKGAASPPDGVTYGAGKKSSE